MAKSGVLNWTDEKTTNIPGALAKTEVAFLKECGAYATQTRGDIVEFGAWLGKSTDLLNGNLREKEEHWVYDRFLMEEWMKHRLELEVGQGFRYIFDENTKHCQQLRVQAGGIETFTWTRKTGIRIMFIDAFKYQAVTKHGVEHWFPYLLPGALVMDQDFLWSMPTHGTMHLLMYRLREFLTPVIRASCLVAFRVEKQIPKSFLDEILDDNVVSLMEMKRIYEHWHDCLAISQISHSDTT